MTSPGKDREEALTLARHMILTPRDLGASHSRLLAREFVSLFEQLGAYEDALEQIVAMRIARGGPENEWWAIARRAVTAYDDSIPAKKREDSNTIGGGQVGC